MDQRHYIFAAINNSNPEIVKWLLDNNFKHNAKDKIGFTPFAYAAGYNQSSRIMEIFEKIEGINAIFVKNLKNEALIEIPKDNFRDLNEYNEYLELSFQMGAYSKKDVKNINIKDEAPRPKGRGIEDFTLKAL